MYSTVLVYETVCQDADLIYMNTNSEPNSATQSQLTMRLRHLHETHFLTDEINALSASVTYMRIEDHYRTHEGSALPYP